MFRVQASDLEHVRECLQWLRLRNLHFKTYWANAERFSELFGRLQAVIPRGCLTSEVRMFRTPRVQARVVSTLDKTLGSENTVLVMVDHAELPRS